MSLRADATLEAFLNRIIHNKDIMDIMKLPVISKEDTEDIIDEKRKVLIDKFISKTAQVPYELGKKFEDVEINGITYSEYGKIRITISFAQSIKLNHDLFGNPQVDINVYYDNTEMENVFKLFDLISDEFSGQDLVINTGNEKSFIRNIRCEGQTAQTAMINNYERIGIRFSFFATLYKN